MEPVRDWSALVREMLEEIAERITLLEDFTAFRGVCTYWRDAATKDKFVNSCSGIPLLMLADNGCDEREFYSLSKRRIAMRVSFPEANGKHCMEANFGWLLIDDLSGDLCLLNPFSRSQIPLPSYKTVPNYKQHETPPNFSFVERAVLSANPSHTSDFVLTVLFSGGRLVYFWRPNDLSWTLIESPEMALSDVIHYHGKIYVINFGGKIFVCDDFSCNNAKLAQVPIATDGYMFGGRQSYLVETSRGELLAIGRDGCSLDDDNTYGATDFVIVRLDLEKCEWEEVTSLDDDAIFVGHSAARSVHASVLSNGIKPNYIYFTDDSIEAYYNTGGGGRDMGIYNVKNKSIERFDGVESVSVLCPPIWISF